MPRSTLSLALALIVSAGGALGDGLRKAEDVPRESLPSVPGETWAGLVQRKLGWTQDPSPPSPPCDISALEGNYNGTAWGFNPAFRGGEYQPTQGNVYFSISHGAGHAPGGPEGMMLLRYCGSIRVAYPYPLTGVRTGYVKDGIFPFNFAPAQEENIEEATHIMGEYDCNTGELLLRVQFYFAGGAGIYDPMVKDPSLVLDDVGCLVE